MFGGIPNVAAKVEISAAVYEPTSSEVWAEALKLQSKASAAKRAFFICENYR